MHGSSQIRTARWVVAVAVALRAVACSGGSDDDAIIEPPTVSAIKPSTPVSTPPPPVASAGCSSPQVVKAGETSEHTVQSGGVERKYLLVLPDSYDGKTPLPIVLGLHALTVSNTFIPAGVGFGEIGAKHPFIGVAPSGRLDGPTPFWFAAPVADNYDVTFIGDLLDALDKALCVDTSKTFSTGMSNGAQMSSLLACRMSDRITAIAPVSGVEYLEPCDGKPVPVLAFHGDADPILPYTGGGLNATKIADIDYWKGKVPAGLPKPLGVDESMRLWAEHNGCNPEPSETEVSPHVVRRLWSGCEAATVLYVIKGAGHQWPGKPMPSFDQSFGPGTTEIDATAEMTRFFFERNAS